MPLGTLTSPALKLSVATRVLPAHGRLQIQEPFDRLGGRNDLDEAYATVTVESGDGVIAYDRAPGGATTVSDAT